MELETVLALIIGNGALIIPLFLWNRSESRADMRHTDAKLESTRELVRAIHDENRNVISSIQEEMKDFHNRLCTIEARKNNA